MSFREWIVYAVFPLLGYLLGSIPFAWVIGKAKGVDIRTVGSKNIGATNLGRTLGKRFFFYAFFLDAAKGFLPTLVVSLLIHYWNGHLMGAVDGSFMAASGSAPLSLPFWSALLTPILAVLGHLFPLWLQFKGGKGVATGFGCVLGIWPLYTISGLVAVLFFIGMLMLYRYISLASMTSALLFASLVVVLGGWNTPWINTFLPWNERLPFIVVAFLFAGMIVFRHRANISRLMRGTEPMVGQREVDKAKLRND